MDIESRIKEENEETIRRLVEQLRSPLGVIPFVGAGISAPFGYKQWGAFLGTHGERLKGKDRRSVSALLLAKDFETAAALIEDSLGADAFQHALEESFNDDRLSGIDLSRGALSLIPFLTSGPVITTNFDRVLEHGFEAGRRPFAQKVYGANHDEVVQAFQQNRLVLWKIHGDYMDRRSRVLSRQEYKTHYVQLRQLLWFALTNRPSLFLGCSLLTDRTVEVLAKIRQKHKAITHYAVVPAPLKRADLGRREDELRRMGVRPIWYPAGKYEEIETRLAELVDRSSSSPLKLASRVSTPAAGALQAAQSMLQQEIRTSQTLPRSRARGERPPYVSLLEFITSGKIEFFLGAGACLGRLPLSRQFYHHLARKFGPTGKRWEPSRIAQHFADRHGRQALYFEVDRFLSRTRPRLTMVHWFLATLPGRLRAKGYQPAPLLILTTNYDDWMERALEAAGEPYHFFSYRAGEPYSGSFIYRDLKGDSSVIDRPSHFRRLSGEATVLLKYHGGLHLDLPLPVTYIFTQQDFVELAGRTPGALPRAVLERLESRSLLFLGHGLGDDSTETMMRALKRETPDRHSWAIQLGSDRDWRLYWKQLRVDILDRPLEIFIPEMDRLVQRLRPLRK